MSAGAYKARGVTRRTKPSHLSEGLEDFMKKGALVQGKTGDV